MIQAAKLCKLTLAASVKTHGNTVQLREKSSATQESAEGAEGADF